MAKNWEFHLAEKICALAVRLYLFEDKDNVIIAKMKSIEIKNHMRVPINESEVQK